MLCCLLSIRRDRRLAGFHEADMIDLTSEDARQKLLDKINRVVANLGAEAGRKTIKAEAAWAARGPKRENRGETNCGPRGPRKCLKRLDPDKEIKVNSKDFPRKSKTIPKEFPRNFQEFKGKSKTPAGSGDSYTVVNCEIAPRRPLVRRRLWRVPPRSAQDRQSSGRAARARNQAQTGAQPRWLKERASNPRCAARRPRRHGP